MMLRQGAQAQMPAVNHSHIFSPVPAFQSRLAAPISACGAVRPVMIACLM